MHVEIIGGDLPGLEALRRRMADANRSVLVGVPAGASEDGGHKRTEEQNRRFVQSRSKVAARAAKRENSRLLKSAQAKAGKTADRLFRAYTMADVEEFESGPLASALRRNVADAKKNAKAAYTVAPRKIAVSDKPIPLAMIAAVHEFGCPERNIPERPVLRQGMRNGIPKFIRLNELNLRAVVLGGKTVDEAINMLGVVAVGEVKREFTSPNPAFRALLPMTIKRKGSSRPLVDTGQLRQSITYVVDGQQSARAKVVE